MKKICSLAYASQLSRQESGNLKGGAPAWPYYSQCPDEPDVCFPGFSTACNNYCKSNYGKRCVLVNECILF